MRYLDKQLNLADGEGYTRDYLEDSFDVISNSFLPSLQSEEAFNRFRNQQYKSHSPHADSDFKSLLLREQEGRCCYCMRRIGPDVKDSNIEHLVPKKSPAAEFTYYASYSGLLNYHVCHSQEFEGRSYTSKQAVIRSRTLPHMVAYGNLVASCMDIHHCNNARGSERIPPLPIVQGIEGKYFYSPAGMMVTEDLDAEYDRAIGVLKLNYETLILIRLLWRKVVSSVYTPDQVVALSDVSDKQSFLCKVFGKASITDLSPKWQNFAPISDNGSTYYWDLFVRYDWFYYYYQHHDKSGNRL